jgi:preprotein translocase subunit SecG
MMDTIFSMNTFWWALMLVYIPISLGLVTLVLLQQGKGGGLAGALGGGGGDNVFGTKSAHTMPVKLTYVGAGLFILLAIMLSVVSSHVDKGAAPDLVTEVGESGAPIDLGPTNELDSLGLGTGVVNNAVHESTSIVIPKTAPAEVAPVVDAPAESAPAETAPVEDAPAETAPVVEAPAEEAPAAE